MSSRASIHSGTTSVPTESILGFYQRTQQPIPGDLMPSRSSTQGHFNVKQTTVGCAKTPYNRRDYFKICLTTGQGKGWLRYRDQEILVEGPSLMFSHPSVPASLEVTSTLDRFYCVFDHRFMEGHIRSDLQFNSPLFNAALHPVISLQQEETEKIRGYLREQASLLESDYPFKWDMIRSLLLLVLHEGLRLQQPPARLSPPQQLVKRFFALLDQQFPVDTPSNPLPFLSPVFFAEKLFVHVNHLNSAVKKATGKTTSAFIQSRLIAEAKSLLQQTDWDVAQIAYALGFQYPSHFNKYFKKLTLCTPLEFRSGRRSSSSI